MKTTNQYVGGISSIFLIMFLLTASLKLYAQIMLDEVNEKNLEIPNVPEQFFQLRTQGEWIAAFPDPRNKITGGTSTAHYQGIVRAPFRPGQINNIFYVSKSGDACNNEGQDCVNYLGTVEIASANERENSPSLYGETLGSNLLLKGVETGGTIPIINGIQIATQDKVVNSQTSSFWKHPGGMQMVGDILAVAYEQPIIKQDYTRSDGVTVESVSKIAFYHTENAKQPRQLSYTLDMAEVDVLFSSTYLDELTGKPRFEAGVAAITQLPDDRFMLMVTYALNAAVAVFISNEDSFFTYNQQTEKYIENPNFKFEFYDLWEARELNEPGRNSLPWRWARSTFNNDKVVSAFQQLTLINQMDGRIFIAGTLNTNKLAPVIKGQDLISLFEVNGFPGDLNAPNGQIKLNHVAQKVMKMTSHDEIGAGATHGNGNAGVGFYVSPTRELIAYSIAHFENDEDVLRMAEFRHKDHVYLGNKIGSRFQPNHLGDTVVIEQNENFTIDASAHYINSWGDFFQNTNYNSGNLDIIQLMEYTRQNEDDFQNFSKLDGAGIDNGFNDKLSSYKTGLAADHILFFYDDRNFEKLLFGRTPFAGSPINGQFLQDNNIGSIANDKISSSQIFSLVDLFGQPINDDNILTAFSQNIAILTGVSLSNDELLKRWQLSAINAKNWEWDTDSDGIFETRTSGPRLNFQRSEIGTYQVRLRHKGVDTDVFGQPVEKTIIVEESVREVPNVVGLTSDEAKVALDEVDLKFDEVEEYSDTVLEDIVFAQSISPGTLVPKGERVVFTVSRGQNPEVITPNVIGKTVEEAIVVAQNAGLQLFILGEEFNEDFPAGQIFDQKALAGDIVNRNSSIDVIVSKGSEFFTTVPNIVGETPQDAIVLLQDNELVQGDISEDNHPSVAVGLIISQSPAAGEQVDKNTSINFIVSLGPIPDLVGDIDLDGDVDRNDLNQIFAALNQNAEDANDKRDINKDGRITILDARELITLCTLPRCAVIN